MEQNLPAAEGPLHAHVVPLVERLRRRMLVQHGGPRGMDYGWNLQEHDSELHRDAADEIERLRADVHSCHADCSRAGCVNVRLRAALDKIAERTSSDDPCRELVQIARDALRHVKDQRAAQPSAASASSAAGVGPWFSDAVGASVYSDDFAHDVRLNISGDFAGADDRKAFADDLARRLNSETQNVGIEPPYSVGSNDGLGPF